MNNFGSRGSRRELHAILLDLDDTLVPDESAVDCALLATASVAGERYGVDPEALRAAVRTRARELWHRSPSFEYCRRIGISSWEALWSSFSGQDPAMRAQAAWAPSFRSRAWQSALTDLNVNDASLAIELGELFPHRRRELLGGVQDCRQVMQPLSGRYKLGILTNGAADLQREKVQASGIEDLVQAVVISGEVGVGKPDPDIFMAALDALGTEPSAAVMVGDSLPRDVRGAQAVGIRAIWLTHGAARPEDAMADYEITSLADLPHAIEVLECADAGHTGPDS